MSRILGQWEKWSFWKDNVLHYPDQKVTWQNTVLPLSSPNVYSQQESNMSWRWMNWQQIFLELWPLPPHPLAQNYLHLSTSFNLVILIRYGLLGGFELGHAFLDHWSEVADQALHRPRCSVTQGADRVPFNLLGDFPKGIDLFWACVSLHC